MPSSSKIPPPSGPVRQRGNMRLVALPMLTTFTLIAVIVAVNAVPASTTSTSNICASNATLGAAVLAAMNLSYPGLEAAAAAAASGDRGKACQAIADYYRHGTSASWHRMKKPPVPGTAMAGGTVDAMVLNDTYSGFPSPSGPVKIPRTASGGITWTWWGPDHDDEFMNVLNRHSSFTACLSAWNLTGNKIYPAYFDALVQDWVMNLPCNNASSSSAATSGHAKCLPAGSTGAHNAGGERVCQWDAQVRTQCI